MTIDVTADKRAIREIVDQWVIYSDAGDWDRFEALWDDVRSLSLRNTERSFAEPTPIHVTSTADSMRGYTR